MSQTETYGPQSTPAIPPVANLTDTSDDHIALDCPIIVDRLTGLFNKAEPTCRYCATIAGIGDPDLPRKEVIKIRSSGSAYIETAHPNDCMLHCFNENSWVRAEATETNQANKRGWNPESIRFGGFSFEKFQRSVMSPYLEGR